MSPTLALRRNLLHRSPFSVLRSAASDQAEGQHDQRHRDKECAGSRHDGSQRASVGLPAPEVDDEATRLGLDPRQPYAASEPPDPGRVPGVVEVQEIDERQHQQHPCMGVAGPEELLAELPELAASGEESEQRPATIFHADQGQHHDDRQHSGRFHTVIAPLTPSPRKGSWPDPRCNVDSSTEGGDPRVSWPSPRLLGNLTLTILRSGKGLYQEKAAKEPV